MSKRLQVLLPEADYQRIRRVARRRSLTVAEWVRQVLRAATRSADAGAPERKLGAIRAAARHEFPTADIDEMLADISRGYE